MSGKVLQLGLSSNSAILLASTLLKTTRKHHINDSVGAAASSNQQCNTSTLATGVPKIASPPLGSRYIRTPLSNKPDLESTAVEGDNKSGSSPETNNEN
jgi:hypothetical protein